MPHISSRHCNFRLFEEERGIRLIPHIDLEVDGWRIKIDALRHVDPEELHISGLDRVTSAAEARNIKLTQKQAIESLTLEWTFGAWRSVEDMELLAELVPPINLAKFCMKGYNSASFPDWVLHIRLHLPELVRIELCDAPEIICLPPLGQLPNLQELVMERLDRIQVIGDGFCGGARAFPQLTRFRLRSMKNLEKWNTMYMCDEDGVKKFMFPNLEDLSICHCSKLRLKPCPPRSRTWEVENSDHVLSSWRDGGNWGQKETTGAASSSTYSSSAAATITQLRIIRCTDITAFLSPTINPGLPLIESLWLEEIDNLEEIPEWFGNLVGLQELVITGCTEMSNLQHLSSLRVLCLRECHSIAALPEWPRSCLEELIISDCGGIKSLPKSILNNLTRVYISDCCPELAQWCKENMMQLEHIEHKIMEDSLISMPSVSSEEDVRDNSSQCHGLSSISYEDGEDKSLVSSEEEDMRDNSSQCHGLSWVSYKDGEDKSLVSSEEEDMKDNRTWVCSEEDDIGQDTSSLDFSKEDDMQDNSCKCGGFSSIHCEDDGWCLRRKMICKKYRQRYLTTTDQKTEIDRHLWLATPHLGPKSTRRCVWFSCWSCFFSQD